MPAGQKHTRSGKESYSDSAGTHFLVVSQFVCAVHVTASTSMPLTLLPTCFNSFKTYCVNPLF